MGGEGKTTAIAAAAGGVVQPLGIVIDTVTVNRAGKRQVVRVVVARDLQHLPQDDDTSEIEPLTLDEIAEATRAVNNALDESEVMGEQPYTLEVSSIGVGSPLVRYEHFRANVGRMLALTETSGQEHAERLVSAGPDGIRLGTLDASPLPYEQISRAVVQVEFNRPSRKEQS